MKWRIIFGLGCLVAIGLMSCRQNEEIEWTPVTKLSDSIKIEPAKADSIVVFSEGDAEDPSKKHGNWKK